MKKHFANWLIVAVVLAGCGGGGGGGGSNVPDSYDGAVTQATLTLENVSSTVDNAWESTRLGTDSEEALPTLDASGNVIGDCGGTATVSMNDNQAGSFNGSISFNDYCSLGTVMNGVVSFSGNYNTQTADITNFTLSFNNLNVVDSTEPINITFVEGDISYDLNPDMSGEVDTFDMVIRDNDQNKTYWLKDFVIDIDYGVDDTVTIEGTFYDHDAGYIDISTLTPLVVTTASGPTGGVLLVSGLDSKAKLTFQADGSTVLELDANNDGNYVVVNP